MYYIFSAARSNFLKKPYQFQQANEIGKNLKSGYFKIKIRNI